MSNEKELREEAPKVGAARIEELLHQIRWEKSCLERARSDLARYSESLPELERELKALRRDALAEMANIGRDSYFADDGLLHDRPHKEIGITRVAKVTRVPLNSYLLVYNRALGKLSTFTDFGADREAAYREQRRLETAPSLMSDWHGENLEIVVLHSDSEETLRKTHSRYWL